MYQCHWARQSKYLLVRLAPFTLHAGRAARLLVFLLVHLVLYAVAVSIHPFILLQLDICDPTAPETAYVFLFFCYCTSSRFHPFGVKHEQMLGRIFRGRDFSREIRKSRILIGWLLEPGASVCRVWESLPHTLGVSHSFAAGQILRCLGLICVVRPFFSVKIPVRFSMANPGFND